MEREIHKINHGHHSRGKVGNERASEEKEWTRKERLSKDCVKSWKSGIAEDGNEIKLGNKGACDKKCLWAQGYLL